MAYHITYKVCFVEHEFPMLNNVYSLQKEYIGVWLPGELVDLNTIEEIIKNKKNLDLIQIYELDAITQEWKLVVRAEKQYSEYGYIRKEPRYVVAHWNEDGLRDDQYVEAIEVRILAPTAQTQINNLQSNLDYIAILEGIDLDTDGE